MDRKGDMQMIEEGLDLGRVAIIGCGNIGGALIEGLLASVISDPLDLVACDSSAERIRALVQEHGVTGTVSVADAIADVDIVIIALKPNIAGKVLGEVSAVARKVNRAPLIVSVVAGVTVAELDRSLGGGFRIVRVMPNLPCLIGQGMSVIFGHREEDVSLVDAIFASIGRTAIVGDEVDLDAATGLSGSGPAFAFLFIEALADGGVKMGLTRETSLMVAAQTVLGASALVLSSGLHPSELKDMVASPGGTTIVGLHELENGCVRGAVMTAVEKSTQRSRELIAKKMANQVSPAQKQ